MTKNKLFNNRIEPACEYCENGTPTKDQSMVLCPKCGVVAPYFSCKRFLYAPLKRVPRPTPQLPKYDRRDFEL